MKWTILVSATIIIAAIIETFAFTKDNNVSSNRNVHSQGRRKRAIDPNRRQIIKALENMQRHLVWGSLLESDHNLTDNGLGIPFYTAYGPCNSSKQISFEQISGFTDWSNITYAYMEIYSIACVREYVLSIQFLIGEGYIRLGPANSLTFPRTANIFEEKVKLTYREAERLRFLMELVAFSQVYVSWHMFPVIPVDPNGKQIPQRCFIELVTRLHALDLAQRPAYWYIGKLSNDMGMSFKPILKKIHTEYVQHNDEDGGNLQEKRQCLIVTMGLLEFLIKHARYMRQGQCAHDAFKEFFKDREDVYVTKVNGYRRT
ncbi:unnamed protein product [Orchesella dallaii]|uniref:Uncharacterized protein n=1 Tax=Orchesella dallaii TaxID=48710 RepID=A0ABP1R4D0_9HEXA